MNITTKSIDVERIKADNDVREWASRYTTLRRVGQGESHGPCPWCGGHDRFRATKTAYHCRPGDGHCGRGGDVIQFVMGIGNVDFPKACEMLSNGSVPTLDGPARTAQPKAKPQKEQPPTWKKKGAVTVATEYRRLFDDDEQGAGACRAYAEGRGLEPQTWLAFKLGYRPDAYLPGTWDEERKERTLPGQPALAIPWYKNGEVIGVRYRFLKKHSYIGADGKERLGESKWSLPGSDFSSSMFGDQALEGNIPELSTLLLVEGEINAMSAWQVCQGTHLDVLSLGSQGFTFTPAMVELIKKYAQVICWLDEDERAQAVTGVLLAEGVKAWPIQSKTVKNGAGKPLLGEDGKPIKRDANDLLKSGELGGVLALHRRKAAEDADKKEGVTYKQERLLWDLWDGAHAWNGCDKETALVIDYIAKTLGKSVRLTEVRPGTWRTMGNDQ